MPALAKSAVAKTSARASVARAARPVSRRAVVASAKYGENSRYFDLSDLENTTGAWDMYGQDEKKRYPDNQSKFFLQATDAISRRESLRGFIALTGIAAITLYGFKGAELASLPITKGPIGPTENGKGGMLRSRL